MVPSDEFGERIHQVAENEKSNDSEAGHFAYAQQQVLSAKTAVIADSRRVQDSLAKVWVILRPLAREHMPNGKLWADLIAIKNRMVFYNPSGIKPNKMKASLALMRDEHAAALKEMICRLDTDLRATT